MYENSDRNSIVMVCFAIESKPEGHPYPYYLSSFPGPARSDDQKAEEILRKKVGWCFPCIKSCNQILLHGLSYAFVFIEVIGSFSSRPKAWLGCCRDIQLRELSLRRIELP